MDKVFNKILDQLEEKYKLTYNNMMIAKRANVGNYYSGEINAYKNAIQIVQEIISNYENICL